MIPNSLSYIDIPKSDFLLWCSKAIQGAEKHLADLEAGENARIQRLTDSSNAGAQESWLNRALLRVFGRKIPVYTFSYIEGKQHRVVGESLRDNNSHPRVRYAYDKWYTERHIKSLRELHRMAMHGNTVALSVENYRLLERYENVK